MGEGSIQVYPSTASSSQGHGKEENDDCYDDDPHHPLQVTDRLGSGDKTLLFAHSRMSAFLGKGARVWFRNMCFEITFLHDTLVRGCYFRWLFRGHVTGRWSAACAARGHLFGADVPNSENKLGFLIKPELLHKWLCHQRSDPPVIHDFLSLLKNETSDSSWSVF